MPLANMLQIIGNGPIPGLRYANHDDVIKWKHFPRYWPFVRGIHRSTVNSPHKGQWRGALMFSLICAWIYSSVNNRVAGDLRHQRAHSDVSVRHSGIRECCTHWTISLGCYEHCSSILILIWFYLFFKTTRTPYTNAQNKTQERISVRRR